ncbi:MAG: homoserine kinase [Microcoleus sp.]
MPATSTITVTVPATTANLGPGFDCIGAALTLHNHFQFSLLESQASETLKITVTGAESAKVKTDDSNLAYQAFVKLFTSIDRPPLPVAIHIDMQVPLARGLGSSATAIVGGLVGANYLAGKPLSQAEVMNLAIEIEGHPDNVVPAFLGGCRLAATDISHPQSQQETTKNLGWQICDIPWNSHIIPVVAIPDFELSTAAARQVLPSDYSKADAIFNAAHLGLLVRALETGNDNWLRAALQDKIHQPYRQSLIKGYEAVQTAALTAGASGTVISGAGPTILALTNANSAPAVEREMAAAWKEFGVNADVRTIALDTQGATISH